MSKHLFNRIVCVCTVCALLLSATSFSAFARSLDDIQDDIDKYSGQLEDSQSTEDEYAAQLAEIQADLDVINKEIAKLNQQIADKNKIINQYQEEINTLQTQIDDAENRQKELEEEISGTYELLSERLCANYMAGETSVLEILLGAGDFEDFLTRLELVKQISDHDASLVSGLQEDIDELNQTKEKLDADKAAVEEKQNTVKTERDAIAADRNEVQKARNLQTSKENEAEQKKLNQAAYSDKLKQMLNDAKEEYDREKAKEMVSGSGSISGGSSGGSSSIGNYPVSSKGMICPLQYSNVTISAGWYGYANHKGIDFITRGATGNTYGKEIRAAADGVVYSAEYHYSWGNNVYINHGNGVYTRYAHCSRMIVSEGDKVQQGQVIAYVGNTGNVSPKPTTSNPHAGAHLHFEVWVNGTRVNPSPWLP